MSRLRTKKDTKSTREKILRVASQMFSNQGYGSTSVRDIAKEAGVNIAAINYHFRSKQELLWQILQNSNRHLREIADEIARSDLGFEDASVAFCERMLRLSSDVRTVMRVFMSPVEEGYEANFQDICKKSTVGPPGYEGLSAILQRSIKRSLSPSEMLFAVRSLFHSILLWTTLSDTPFLKTQCRLHRKHFSRTAILKEIRTLARALLVYLKAEPRTIV